MNHNRIIRVACLQLNSGDDLTANIDRISALVRDAAARRAALVALPENAFLMEAPGERRSPRYAQRDHPGVQAAAKLARENGCWLLIGSVAVAAEDEKTYNRSLLFDPQGDIAAAYDKIHLFDVRLPGGETYAESARMLPGGRAVVAEIMSRASCFVFRKEETNDESNTKHETRDTVKLGLSVCYDLRFPHLYRALAQAGAEILAAPSAFTATTGAAHWHVLLRARAIENGCFVIAPAQTGTHPGGRETYGHALIIDPWGKILAEAGAEEGIILADLDMDLVRRTRAALPSLSHDREFTVKA